MDQPYKKPFAGFLSRSGTDKTAQRGFLRSDTASSSISVSVSALDISDDEKGTLGLTTLHEPQQPVVPIADLVFIHGLGGGSRKTWSFSPDPRHYWPRAWLQADEDFSDVRIHTFGYKADWGERRQSVLDIHDFAQSLLGALRNHPGIRRTCTRIVLVGHSMGGCVAKKTYILARQDPTAADIAGRVHSVFFLGTPHRGSDMAAILENMLVVAWGKKPYVTDLTPNSAALSAINDAFRHLAPELRLWSFYETLPMRVPGAINRIVVERHSATLGYHNEEIAAMHADHRQVCKFETPADPNYKMLRNALVTAVDLIRTAKGKEPGLSPYSDGAANSLGKIPSQPSMSQAEATPLLRSFLGVRESLEGDLANLQVLKQPGSCEWFSEKPCFTSWRNNMAPGILWLVGKPAAGKSALASHVIEQLSMGDAHCSYFICKHAKAGESTLSDCFRSLAFQMAVQDTSVKDALLQLAQDGLTWDKTDDASAWRRLFAGCIFKLPTMTRHFWVVDGLDECANFNVLFTKRLLATLPEQLRLFATSRNLEEIERGLGSLGPNRVSMQLLSDLDTVEDMRLLLMTRLTELGRPETVEDRERMCDKILDKASGSFLWARLVLQEFENAWTEEAMDAILREIPAGLFDMYLRMVQSILEDGRKLNLAHSILTWVVLACRPLTVDELRCAVKLDINQTLQNPAKAIPDLCGQLVFIDQHDKVQVIHETAREFLVDDAIGMDLFIDKKTGHARLGSLLLKYLSGAVLKPSQTKGQQHSGRTRGFAKPVSAAPPVDTALVQYACAFFSEHVYRATSADDPLMHDLSNFLQANNVLSWIEHIASSGDLATLPRTAMNLREYLGRRMKYVPPTDPSVQLVDGWVTDLIRVAAKFRAQLLACPSSIHSLIAPMCPSESVISRLFGRDPRPNPASSGLLVKGLPPGSWDDCLIRMDFQNGQTSALTHGDRFFAIGLSSGQVSLYDPASLQILRHMKHPERVKVLEFSPDDFFLASSGAKHIVIWDPKAGTMVHSFPLRSTALAITFLGVDEILGAFQSCELTKWNLETGEHESVSWKNSGLHGQEYRHVLSPSIPSQPPSRVALLEAPEGVLLAVGYRAQPIFIWNALELDFFGTCEPDVTNNGINAMVFSRNPEVPTLVVSFQDGSLCVFDYFAMEMLVRRSDIYAQTVACSSDGRTLVTGSNQGAIEVFELEQAHDGTAVLSLIYRTNHPLDDAIRGVAFSADGLRFVDVRGKQGRVWAPAALVRKSTSELESSIGSSEADAALLLPPKPSGGMLDNLGDPEITSPLIPTADGKFVVAGKSNGDVVLFSTADAAQLGVIYRHARGASIVGLAIVESLNRMISADDAGRVLVVDLRAPLSDIAATPELQRVSAVLDRRFGGAVAALLANPAGDRLTVHGRHTDQLWEIPTGTIYHEGGPTEVTNTDLAVPASSLPPRPVSPGPGASPSGSLRSVFQHPSNPAWFVLVTQDIARIYSWKDFTKLTAPPGIRLVRAATTATDTFSAFPSPSTLHSETPVSSYHVGAGFIIEHFRPSLSSPPRLYLWRGTDLDPYSPTGLAHPAVQPNLDAISPGVRTILRVTSPSTVLFMDVNLWVCSVELQSLNSGQQQMVEFRQRQGGGFGASASSTNTSGGGITSITGLTPSARPPAPSSSLRLGPRPGPSPIQKPAAHARRHFFALSEWRSGGGGELRCAVAVAPGLGLGPAGRIGGGGGRDVVVFAAGPRLVVVRGGLEFSEGVAAAGHGFVGGGETVRGGGVLAGQGVWRVVSESIHRRSSGW